MFIYVRFTIVYFQLFRLSFVLIPVLLCNLGSRLVLAMRRAGHKHAVGTHSSHRLCLITTGRSFIIIKCSVFILFFNVGLRVCASDVNVPTCKLNE